MALRLASNFLGTASAQPATTTNGAGNFVAYSVNETEDKTTPRASETPPYDEDWLSEPYINFDDLVKVAPASSHLDPTTPLGFAYAFAPTTGGSALTAFLISRELMHFSFNKKLALQACGIAVGTDLALYLTDGVLPEEFGVPEQAAFIFTVAAAKRAAYVVGFESARKYQEGQAFELAKKMNINPAELSRFIAARVSYLRNFAVGLACAAPVSWFAFNVVKSFHEAYPPSED